MNGARSVMVALWVVLGSGCGGAPAAEEAEEHGEHGAEHASEVTLSEEAIARAGIQVGAVTRVTVAGGTAVPAELQADPASTAHVAALVASRVTTVSVRVGDRVTVGQRLAVLASADVGASRAALSEARVRRDAARAARDRQAQLVEAGIGARRSLVEAEANLAAVEAEMRGLGTGLRVVGGGGGATVDITAPVAGVVVSLHASVGEVVEPGSALFVITDPSRLWVVGHVPELDLGIAREGAVGTLSVAAFPGRRWSGHVDFVEPALDEATRTLRIRFLLDQPDVTLRAGLFGQLSLAGERAGPTGLVVPGSALARMDGEDVVFVPADEERTFRSVPVRLGRRDGDVVEVLEGIDENAAVVISGAFTLRSELSRAELAEHED
ncbi:MAG: efflux RND transporter periplasmic adaptor subunit [Deltaproteobacteria bacterium]|nr:efflux RND transporter periplasmic adaptor subunit [Deltaproteobacteria bacterium]